MIPYFTNLPANAIRDELLRNNITPSVIVFPDHLVTVGKGLFADHFPDTPLLPIAGFLEEKARSANLHPKGTHLVTREAMVNQLLVDFLTPMRHEVRFAPLEPILRNLPAEDEILHARPILQGIDPFAKFFVPRLKQRLWSGDPAPYPDPSTEKFDPAGPKLTEFQARFSRFRSSLGKSTDKFNQLADKIEGTPSLEELLLLHFYCTHSLANKTGAKEIEGEVAGLLPHHPELQSARFHLENSIADGVEWLASRWTEFARGHRIVLYYDYLGKILSPAHRDQRGPPLFFRWDLFPSPVRSAIHRCPIPAFLAQGPREFQLPGTRLFAAPPPRFITFHGGKGNNKTLLGILQGGQGGLGIVLSPRSLPGAVTDLSMAGHSPYPLWPFPPPGDEGGLYAVNLGRWFLDPFETPPLYGLLRGIGCGLSELGLFRLSRAGFFKDPLLAVRDPERRAELAKKLNDGDRLKFLAFSEDILGIFLARGKHSLPQAIANRYPESLAAANIIQKRDRVYRETLLGNFLRLWDRITDTGFGPPGFPITHRDFLAQPLRYKEFQDSLFPRQGIPLLTSSDLHLQIPEIFLLDIPGPLNLTPPIPFSALHWKLKKFIEKVPTPKTPPLGLLDGVGKVLHLPESRKGWANSHYS